MRAHAHAHTHTLEYYLTLKRKAKLPGGFFFFFHPETFLELLFLRHRLGSGNEEELYLFNGVSLFYRDPETSRGWDVKDLIGWYSSEVQIFSKWAY